MIVGGSCHDRAMNSTDSPLLTIITLLIGLILGLAIGFLLWRKGAANGTSSTVELTEQLNAARAERDLYKSERDNAMADTKLAGELESMAVPDEPRRQIRNPMTRPRIRPIMRVMMVTSGLFVLVMPLSWQEPLTITRRLYLL